MNRCDYIENIEKYCNKSFIFYPKNELLVGKDEPFKPLDINGVAVQIKPQQMNVKLRPREFSY